MTDSTTFGIGYCINLIIIMTSLHSYIFSTVHDIIVRPFLGVVLCTVKQLVLNSNVRIPDYRGVRNSGM